MEPHGRALLWGREPAGGRSILWVRALSLSGTPGQRCHSAREPPARLCAQGYRSPAGQGSASRTVPDMSCHLPGPAARPLGCLTGHSVPGAPAPKADMSLPHRAAVPLPATTCPSADPLPPHAVPTWAGEPLFLPGAPELCHPPAEPGSPSQLPHCSASSCKSCADYSTPRCGW